MTKDLDISVVIPTRDRGSTLRKTLQSLAQQTLPTECFEVILVDDGSSDNLDEKIGQFDYSFWLEVLRQPRSGPAAARNRGAVKAKGQVIVFLDSDMIAEPDLLRQHWISHQENPGSLVVGPRAPYHHSGQVDPFEIFDYGPDGLDGRFQKQPLTFQEILTCNLSIRAKDWQQSSGFNELFSSNGFEDIEFAYRAVCNGMKVVWNPKAMADHDHPQNMEDRCKRAVSYTCTVPLLFRLHPELRGQIIHLRDKEPIDWKEDSFILILRKVARRILVIRPVLTFLEMIFGWLQPSKCFKRLQVFLYWKIIGSYQLIGMRQGIQSYGWRS